MHVVFGMSMCHFEGDLAFALSGMLVYRQSCLLFTVLSVCLSCKRVVTVLLHD